MSLETILTDDQLVLPLFGAERLPRRPWCSADLAAGLRVRPLATALHLPYIQVNPPRLRLWMLHDVDRPGAAIAWEDAGLPAPAWAATSRVSGHAHLAWALSAPVLTGDGARDAPLRYLAAIEAAFRERLQSDAGYAGLITKNPRHPLWRVLVGPQVTWELGQLAEWVDLPRHLPKGTPEQFGLGRNVTLFDRLRQWAYSAVRRHRQQRNFLVWQTQAYNHALKFNGEFLHPLDEREVWHVAASVARWTWRKDADARAKFIGRQAARGRRSGEIRREAQADKHTSARLLAAQGYSVRAIAEQLGVGKSTAARWLQSF